MKFEIDPLKTYTARAYDRYGDLIGITRGNGFFSLTDILLQLYECTDKRKYMRSYTVYRVEDERSYTVHCLEDDEY